MFETPQGEMKPMPTWPEIEMLKVPGPIERRLRERLYRRLFGRYSERVVAAEAVNAARWAAWDAAMSELTWDDEPDGLHS